MTLEVEYVYDVSIDKLYKLLTDEGFLRRKYEAVGSRRIVITECGQDEDVFRIEWTREVPSNPPSFAKKVLSEWNKLAEMMEWSLAEDGSAHADYLCKVDGVPGSLAGEFDLRSQGKGCVEEIIMEASIPIPLLGKKIAEFAEEDAKRNLDAEYTFTREFLKQC